MSKKNRPVQTGGPNETGNDSIPDNYTTVGCDCNEHDCPEPDCDSPFCGILHRCGKELKTAQRVAPPPPREPARVADTPTTALYQYMAAERAKQGSGNLADYLTLLSDVATCVPPPAAYMRSDGATLIPENTLSAIYGMPSGGKSWVALDVARTVAERGGRVLYWDFEDTKETLLTRSFATGMVDYGVLANIAHVTAALADDKTALQQAALWVKQGDVAGLVIIDACNSAGCPSDGTDVSPWFESHVDPFGKDVTMLLLDHIPKRTDDRAPGAIGSTHKRSRLTGVSLLIEGKAWTPKDDGRVTLRNEKDRHGVLPAGMGKIVGVISGNHVDGKLELRAEPPTNADSGANAKDRVVNALTVAEPSGIRTARAMEQAAGGNKAAVRGAIGELVTEGVIDVSTGKGGIKVYALAREDMPF